ncbi:MAG: cyclic pyranopterin phosphate synthase MoaA [Geobacteraceae bacterium GWB2_52_12]|nr:MAG: cyclic pyranopterin phosphate synthase MoaA [Geobacteraceae bacterium GWB2_52_12]
MNLTDPHGRMINYLRLSVTDRCNMRCTYCMPSTGIPKFGHDDVLSYEELLRIAEAAVALGVEKIRVTGGEPLVRQEIIGFLEQLALIPGLKRLVLTTNGLLLKEMAADLKAVGVESLNISLDSLKPTTFFRITRGGDLRKVLDGIEAAERAGFFYIKINVVVMRGVNDDEVADFAALTMDKPWQIRFIEYMPTLREEGWQSLTVPGGELLAKLSRQFHLTPEKKEALSGPASNYRIAGAKGLVGVITPVSCHFCHECNRIRVTSRGFAKNCLFSDSFINLAPHLKRGDNEAIRAALRCLVETKPERHALGENASESLPFAMSQIGG